MLFHSNAGASKITNTLPMRSDVMYQTANYPDLAEMFGFTGSTFNLWDARSRVLRGADLGKGIDASLGANSIALSKEGRAVPYNDAAVDGGIDSFSGNQFRQIRLYIECLGPTL